VEGAKYDADREKSVVAVFVYSSDRERVVVTTPVHHSIQIRTAEHAEYFADSRLLGLTL
jgi:hypothetical protein